MPNIEFVARNGIISKGDLIVTGSLTSTNGFTGSFSGSTSAPGLTTQVTYNNNGVLSADSGFVYSGSNVVIGGAGRLGIGGNLGTSVDVSKTSNNIITNYTQTVEGNAIAISSNSATGHYLPGLVWYSPFSNPTKPRMGIFGELTPEGSKLYLGTSNVYATGITNQVVINSLGNVGIGTTSPTSRLQVKGSGVSTLKTFLVEDSNSKSNFVVLDNGRVGINIADPTQTGLSISGSINIFDGLINISATTVNPFGVNYGYKQGGYVGLGGTIGAQSTILGNSVFPGSGSSTVRHISGDTGSYIRLGIGSGITFHTNITSSLNVDIAETSNEVFRVTQTGNVGIGRSSPTQKLDVSGSIRVRSGFGYTSDFSGGVFGISILNVDGSDNVVIGSTYSPKNVILTSGIRYDFASTGLGINVTAPSARLQVKGSGTTSATTAFRVENANASASLLVYDNQIIEVNSTITTNQTYLQLGQGGQIAIRLNGAGQRFAGPSYFENYIQGYVIDTKIKTYSSSTNITFHASDNAELARITNSGSIGIGTTSPSYKLDVSGSGNFTDYLTVTGSFTVVTGSTVEFQVNQTGVKIGNATTDSHAVTGSVSISSSFSTSGSALTVYKSGSSVLDIQGSQGQLFSVIDALSGSLMSVNDVSGLPILEVFSDDRVVMGTYGAPALVLSGSNTVSSGSLRGRVVTVPTASGTASMDCSQSNFFSLTLSGSSTLFLSASNIQPGQTVNLRVIQPATSGSLNYGSQFKFAGGIPYSASSTGSAVDLISFISYDTAVLYGSAIKNLS